ncbi:MAG: ribonuclease III [Lachnospiraceae bacterium]|nr:ribonuclease III [Lachnospiraceae bacterium]
MNRDLKELEEVIGYRFADRRLLSHAMTHSSYANEHRWDKTRCNERLEFLGDAVLELVSSDFLFAAYQDMPEGDLTKTRASLVCEPTLAFCAEQIHLGEYLLLGKGEEATGGRFRPSVVSDGMEALIGAIYLDGGFANAKEFIHRFILNDIEHKQLFYDSKTILQELVQGHFEEPLTYELLKEEGPDHNKSFQVCARIGSREVGKGSGRTKKAAEQVAAYHGILTVKAEIEKMDQEVPEETGEKKGKGKG